MGLVVAKSNDCVSGNSYSLHSIVEVHSEVTEVVEYVQVLEDNPIHQIVDESKQIAVFENT